MLNIETQDGTNLLPEKIIKISWNSETQSGELILDPQDIKHLEETIKKYHEINDEEETLENVVCLKCNKVKVDGYFNDATFCPECRD